MNMKKILLLMTAILAIMMVACRPNSDVEPTPTPQPVNPNAEQTISTSGLFMVAEGTPGEYSETDTIALEVLQGNKANIVLENVRFNAMMPIKTTLTLSDLDYTTENKSAANQYVYHITGTGIIPLYKGAPYTQYTVNDLVFEYDTESQTMRISCTFAGSHGDMAVTYEGKKI